MSFEISKVYTDNPFVDELIYYTKLLCTGTVLKMKELADNSETAQSLKTSGLFLTCVDHVERIELFPSISNTAFIAAGITDVNVMNYWRKNRDLIRKNDKNSEYYLTQKQIQQITEQLRVEYIASYEELNPYYRMLHGLPPVDMDPSEYIYVEDYIDQSTLEELVHAGVLPSADPDDPLYKAVPIHKLDKNQVAYLETRKIIDQILEEDYKNRQYLRFLGKNAIPYYFARKANRFDPLYIPTIESDAVERMYRDRLDENKIYVLRTVYSEAFKYESEYYDNFIAIFIIIITMVDLITRVQEFIARKEIFDIRSIQYIFKSYGVPFFEEIPYKYQVAMVKNLHTLLKYKSTATCMVDICSLFGFKNIKIFKYYLLRDRKIDTVTDEYIRKLKEDGSEDLDAEYELKFLKLPLNDQMGKYIRDAKNYIDYDEITEGDPKWDGGLDHRLVKDETLKQEFNFSRTKYISIDTIYDIAKMSAQQSYFFNMLYDNTDFESLATVQVPAIEAGTEFKVADLFTLLTILSYHYRNVKDTIMDTQSKVLYVNGFNFKADLAKLASEIGPKKMPGIIEDGIVIKETVVDPGSTLHAQEQVDENYEDSFKIPKSAIPSFEEMMNLFINNLNVRDELIKGMAESDNIEVYKVYQKLYDALMTVELTMDYYKINVTKTIDPETGEEIETRDFYRDMDGDATYCEFLRYKNPTLYETVANLDSFEDETSRNAYISNLIDSIVYALEQFIDSDKFQSLFYNLPVMGIEAVKQYIATVINFYKSYKVDFLGLNTIYVFDDKYEGAIRLIDGIMQKRYFQKNEIIDLVDRFGKVVTSLSYKDNINLIDRIYLDISTWLQINARDDITIDDRFKEYLAQLCLYTIIQFNEKIKFGDYKQTLYSDIDILDRLAFINSISNKNDSIDFDEKAWIYDYYDSNDFMDKVSPSDSGKIIVADDTGNAKASVYINDEINGETLNAVVEKAIADYLKEKAVMKEDVTSELSDESASEDKIASETSVFEALRFKNGI